LEAGVVGWYLWLHGGANRTPLKVARASAWELSLICVFVAASTLGLWKVLATVGGSASFWDAATTSISLGSQWLLNRKRLESWIGWIIVDVIYVPLYIYKDLYLTAILYGLFLVMAVMGLRAWDAAWRRNSEIDAAETVNQARATVPVSGTLIRSAPLKYIGFLEPCVRAYFVHRVVLIGAESTGKTTLAQQLAERFDTTWVPEYGREHWEKKSPGFRSAIPCPTGVMRNSFTSPRSSKLARTV
jgi:hypothetical protein